MSRIASIFGRVGWRLTPFMARSGCSSGWRTGHHAAHPGLDKSALFDGTFSRADFVFDRSRNIYVCPNGKLLHTTGTVIDGSTLRYRASKRDCDLCAFKMQCCPNTPARQIPRDLNEDARDVARALAKTAGFEQSRRERKRSRCSLRI